MKTNYCDGWYRSQKCITQEWTEDQAREAHNKREMYTVVLGGLKSPYCFVEIRDDFISVGFLDDNLREYMVYDFKEFEPNKLFLTHAFYRSYDGDTDKILKVETYTFSREGRVQVGIKYTVKRTKEVSESEQDVSGNYNDYPEFGDYRVLTRKER